MVTTINELTPADTENPSSTTYIKTQESNLDSLQIVGSLNLDLEYDEEVLYEDYDNNEIFQGIVRKSDTGNQNKYNLFDYGIELGEITIKKNYQNQTPLEIIEDVIANYTNLTFVNFSGIVVTDTINLYPTGGKYASQIINDMHKTLGTTHSVDNDKNFNLEVEGFEDNDIVLEVGVNCDLNDKSVGWSSDTDLLCDGIEVNGASKTIEETKLLSGTGSQTTFTLANPYTSIQVEYPIGTKLSPFVEDVTTGDYKINKETAEVIFTIAPANATDNIKIYYTYDIPINYEIDGIGDNPHKVTIYEDYLKEVLDCIGYAEKYKLKFGKPIRSCDLIYKNSNSTLFKPNQRVRVIDPYHKVNKNYIDDIFIIKSVTRIYGGGVSRLIISVGDSTTFSYNNLSKINTTINDLNQRTTTADIFNEGVSIEGDNNVLATTSSNVKLFVATLPTDILVYDANRKYSTETDYQGYKYINGGDYLQLFNEERD